MAVKSFKELVDLNIFETYEVPLGDDSDDVVTQYFPREDVILINLNDERVRQFSEALNVLVVEVDLGEGMGCIENDISNDVQEYLIYRLSKQ